MKVTKIIYIVATCAIMGCGNNGGNNDDTSIMAQDYMVMLPTSTDSLEYMLKTPKRSVAMQIRILSELYRKSAQKDTATAFEYIHQIRVLQERISDSFTMAVFYNALGYYYMKQDNLQEAITMYNKALSLLPSDSSTAVQDERGRILTNKGFVFQQYDDYETAYELYLEAEKLFLETKNYNKLITLYGAMGNIFLRNSNVERNKQIVQKEHDIIDKVTDLNIIADYYIHQSSVCFYDEDYAGSTDFQKKALDILEQTQNQHQLTTLYYNMGLFAREQGFYKESEQYYKKSLSAAEQSGKKTDICDALLGMGSVLFYQKKFNDAEIYMQKALQVAQEIESKLLLRNVYDYLSCLEYERNNLKQAFAYRELADEYEVELVSSESQNKMNFMAVKYDLAQKEADIKDLENKTTLQKYHIKLIDTVLISIAVFIFIMSILITLYIRYNKRKRLLAETRLKQMEQERQLVAAQAALDGENAERSRLARDLHDGLGSMLSLVKLNLPDMKSGGVLEADDVVRFNIAIAMLDGSISELRRVAHHMMPESLMRYGLKASLSDFCQSIPIVSFHYFGSDQRMDSKLEILIYRAAHELINNALKHSEASKINVQLVQESDRVSLTVYDDGKGFDTTIETKGMGLENIRNRMETYNGKMTIYSAPGKGTEINVEIEFNSMNNE